METFLNNLHLTLMFANKLLKGLLLTPIFCLVFRDPNSFGHVLFHGYHEFFVVVQKLVSQFRENAASPTKICLFGVINFFYNSRHAIYVVKRLFKKSEFRIIPPTRCPHPLGVPDCVSGSSVQTFTHFFIPPNNRIHACISLT